MWQFKLGGVGWVRALSASFSTNLLGDLGQVPSPLWTSVCSFVKQEVLQGLSSRWVLLALGTRGSLTAYLALACFPPGLLRAPLITACFPPSAQAPGHQPGAEHWPSARDSAIRQDSRGGPYIWGPSLGLRGGVVLWVSFPARCPCVINEMTMGAEGRAEGFGGQGKGGLGEGRQTQY